MLMNKKNKNVEENSDDTLVKGIAYGLIFIFMFLFVVINNRNINNEETTNNKNKNYEGMTKESLLNYYDNFTGNYSFEISKTLNDNTTVSSQYTDEVITLYKSDLFKSLDLDGYILYNGETYKVSGSGITKSKMTYFSKILDNNYYNIDLIKNVSRVCEYTLIDSNNAKCSFKMSDYFKEYNYINSTTYKVKEDNDENIDINIEYENNILDNFSIDYSKINNIINPKNNNKIVYTIKLLDKDKNNFSEYQSYIDENNN